MSKAKLKMQIAMIGDPNNLITIEVSGSNDFVAETTPSFAEAIIALERAEGFEIDRESIASACRELGHAAVEVRAGRNFDGRIVKVRNTANAWDPFHKNEEAANHG